MTLESDTHVDEKRGCQSTEYRIRGPLHGVFRKIEGLLIEYHPCGYGTYVHSISTDNGVIYNARVSRSNSCD